MSNIKTKKTVNVAPPKIRNSRPAAHKHHDPHENDGDVLDTDEDKNEPII
jgi:hypothetical protein